MRQFKLLVVLLALALVTTLASSAVQRARLQVQDWECPPAPASCARPVVVLGFPFPYVSDYHGLSAVGRASLTGALLGEDLFHSDAFVLNLLVYFTVFALMWLAWQIHRR